MREGPTIGIRRDRQEWVGQALIMAALMLALTRQFIPEPQTSLLSPIGILTLAPYLCLSLFALVNRDQGHSLLTITFLCWQAIAATLMATPGPVSITLTGFHLMGAPLTLAALTARFLPRAHDIAPARSQITALLWGAGAIALFFGYPVFKDDILRLGPAWIAILTALSFALLGRSRFILLPVGAVIALTPMVVHALAPYFDLPVEPHHLLAVAATGTLTVVLALALEPDRR